MKVSFILGQIGLNLTLALALAACASDRYKVRHISMDDLMKSSNTGGTSKTFYVFESGEPNYEEGEYGFFCSDEYDIRIHLNKLSSDSFGSRVECESSDRISELRSTKKAEVAKALNNPKVRKYKKHILKAEVVIGMPSEAVLLSLGKPIEVHKTEMQSSINLQLVYPTQYVYLTNGRVVAIQSP
jgi:hypothetical protein